MDFEQEIKKIQERLNEALLSGRNPIAIQGKFSVIYSLHNELRAEFDKFKIDILKQIKTLSEKDEQVANCGCENSEVGLEVKRKPGRPKSENLGG